jgi:diguanylate cyclase
VKSDLAPLPGASPGFQEAGGAVLEFLSNRLPFGLWMVTRTDGDDWIVLSASDHGYSVKPGDLLRWSDSFCSRMVDGKGPRIAPRSAEVPTYAEAPIGRQVPIEAYVGVPIMRADNSLFGTLEWLPASGRRRATRRRG